MMIQGAMKICRRSAAHHRSPAGRRGLRAQAEEAEGRLKNDGVSRREHGGDEDRR